jgi:hypothetical protein
VVGDDLEFEVEVEVEVEVGLLCTRRITNEFARAALLAYQGVSERCWRGPGRRVRGRGRGADLPSCRRRRSPIVATPMRRVRRWPGLRPRARPDGGSPSGVEQDEGRHTERDEEWTGARVVQKCRPDW